MATNLKRVNDLKNLRGSLPLKITAVILSFITVATAVLSITAIGFLVALDFYSRPFDNIRTDTLEGMALSELNNAYWHCVEEGDIDYYYSDKNVIVTVTDANGEVVYSNDEGADTVCEAEDKFSRIMYYTDNGEEYGYYSDYDGEYYYVREWNHKTEEYDVVKVTEVETDIYNVSIKIPGEMQFSDRFWIIDRLLYLGSEMQYSIIVIFIVSLLLSVVVLSYLFASCGHRDTSGVITLNFVDRIPFEIPIAAVVAAYIFGIWGIVDLFYDWRAQVISGIIVVTILYFLTLGLILSLTTRAKTRTLFKNTLCRYILSFVFKAVRRVYRSASYILKGIPTAWKAAVILLAVLFAEFMALLIWQYDIGFLIVLWVIRSIILSAAVLLISIGFYRLKKGSERIAKGELDAKIDKKYLRGDLADFADNLNNIHDGLSLAVDERMRSERLKTELITNVSHDIKTPLTSIINYVDLIKKEEIQNEKAKEYISVLDRQSIRLKKLIEDLVEASKASTGNLTVELSSCDAAVLLTQASGEYDEKLSRKNLTLMINTPEAPIRILADGRRLWRVFDNLMNNICKYAQSGTRVYLDLVEKNGKAVITFKNISEYPLNISGDELTERFVRGDRSRNGEGSGLGLSIAKSLVELQGGRMNIIIDGDLFKAEIIFDKT